MARELSLATGAHLTETQIEEMARSSLFQSAVGDLLEKAHRYKDGMASEDITGGAASEAETNASGVDDTDGNDEPGRDPGLV